MVSFAPDTCAVLASAGPHGTADPEGAVSVARGNNQFFAATVYDGYTPAAWMVDGVMALTETPNFVLADVQTNHTVKVLFGRQMSDCAPLTHQLASAMNPGVWLLDGQAGDQVRLSFSMVQ